MALRLWFPVVVKVAGRLAVLPLSVAVPSRVVPS
jgi:hypothetical protein